MKTVSKYNHLFEQGENYVLYNVASDGILSLCAELKELICKYKDNADPLQNIHPTLFEALVEHGMLVDGGADEAELLLKRWKEADDNPEYFTLMLLPTLDCNLRCWYCYEKHVKGSVMSEETQESICRLVDRQLENTKLKQLNFCFFGGEPLLTFRNVDLPLLQYARKVTREKGVRLTAQFTTNGVLLTEKVRQSLKELELDAPPSFQITIDGNREKHNESRCSQRLKETFDVTLNNIRETLRDGMFVVNRFNYSSRNVETFIDNLQEYESIPIAERENLQFDFQPVWQEETNGKTREKAMEIVCEYEKRGLSISIDKRYNNARCPEDGENQIGINYDGLIYKCSARDIHPERKDGVLNADGTIEWGPIYSKRMGLRYGLESCKTCSIYPICHCGCSQLALECSESGECPRGYSEKDKNEIIVGRLTYLLKHSV